MKSKTMTLTEITQALHQANQLKRYGITISHTAGLLFRSSVQQQALLDDVRRNDVFKMALPNLSDQVALELACFQEDINNEIDEYDLSFVCNTLGMEISREMINKMTKYI